MILWFFSPLLGFGAYNKCYTFLHHDLVSIDWLCCVSAGGLSLVSKHIHVLAGWCVLLYLLWCSPPPTHPMHLFHLAASELYPL